MYIVKRYKLKKQKDYLGKKHIFCNLIIKKNNW